VRWNKKAIGINKPMAPKIVEAVGSSWVCPRPRSKYDYFRRRRADPILKPKKQKLRKRTCTLVSIKMNPPYWGQLLGCFRPDVKIDFGKINYA
jgi:hypothetical protein